MREICKFFIGWIVMLVYLGFVIGMIAKMEDIEDVSTQSLVMISIVIVTIGISCLFGFVTRPKDK
ncbi:hypothetical protein [Effusibacillus dendaii]|uniref:Uncharacterized protein n=1 Tax=Effusibacillus dendaii TaxID=2743772 RepID=A0A7I8DED7_9BACL|nr:hypothetical protein [Effusibacillus dendaii]BCJ88407.1 hypothetical protein skT53_33920 [Effusibacillus dendaii]